MKEEYENLANAIVLQAARDYRNALKNLQRNPRSRSALYEKNEIEQFFHSDWYLQLTSVEPEMLIKQLNQEVSA